MADTRQTTNGEPEGQADSAAAAPAAKKRGRPRKKTAGAVAGKKRGRPARKRAEPVQAAEERPRRGRPVSVEALRTRLTAAQDALKAEKARRRTQVQELKAKLAAATASKRELKAKLGEASDALARVREDERAAVQREKMERAREEAVQKFVARWEEKYLASMARKRRSPAKRRGRPRKK